MNKPYLPQSKNKNKKKQNKNFPKGTETLRLEDIMTFHDCPVILKACRNGWNLHSGHDGIHHYPPWYSGKFFTFTILIMFLKVLTADCCQISLES